MSTNTGSAVHRFLDLTSQAIKFVNDGARTESEINELNGYLQLFKERRIEALSPMQTSMEIARCLLGDHLITKTQLHDPRQAAAWERMNVPWEKGGVALRGDIKVPYSEEVLGWAGRMNELGMADWWLVYAFEAPMRALLVRYGTDSSIQPCFSSNRWWLRSQEDGWANSRSEEGYYLLNMKGRFQNLPWELQEKCIQDLGEDYARADERVVSQAAMVIFEITGVRVLSDWFHLGHMLNSSSSRICVGGFSDQGWRVVGSLPGDARGDLRVVVMRKPQN